MHSDFPSGWGNIAADRSRAEPRINDHAPIFHPSLLVAALLLAACDGPAFFQAPISEPGQVRYDERLIGSWHSFDEKGRVLLLLIPPPEEEGKAHLRPVLTFTNTDLATAWFVTEAYASEIDGSVYYNTRFTSSAGTKILGDSFQTETIAYGEYEGFMIIQAEVDAADRLSLRIISELKPRTLKLKSREMSCGEDCDETLYELSSAELAELIRTTPRDELFELYIGPFARMETGRPVLGSKPPPPQ